MDKTRAGERLGSVLGSGLILFRLAAAPSFLYAFLAGARFWTLGVFALAVLTDALDGRVGRRWGGCPFLGPYSDAIADLTLVLAAFAAFVMRGIYPVWTMPLIAGMFAQFLLTSRRERPIYDPVGKYYGLFLFCCVAVTLLWAHPVVRRATLVGMVGFTLISLASRAAFLLGLPAKRVPGHGRRSAAGQSDLPHAG
jgi:phosphatidylglycerophosphate synthase